MPHEARFYDRWIVKAVLSQARACITLSPKEEKRLRALLPEMKIYPGRLPLHRLSSVRMSKEEARKMLGIQTSEQVLLFFGIVRAYKGLGILLGALGMLARQGIRPRLLVVGEFWEKEQVYHEQIQSLGLSSQVIVVNRYIPNEETSLYFTAADLFVAPYLEGSQSGAITVALDNYLPILASDRIITEAVSSLIETFPAGNEEALAAKISQTLQHGLTRAVLPTVVDDGWAQLLQLIESTCQKFNIAVGSEK
jgi:glycosyltransferase involved in cell wall biosynthesis